jgi:protein-tyrosine-phosphatase
MNSKQGTRYIKKRMGNDLKRQILIQNGIISEEKELQKKPSILNCPRCSLVNAIDNKYCSKCSYPLIRSAFDEIKEAENRKIQEIQQKHQQDMKAMREEIREDMKNQMAQLISRLKPEIVKEGLV